MRRRDRNRSSIDSLQPPGRWCAMPKLHHHAAQLHANPPSNSPNSRNAIGCPHGFALGEFYFRANSPSNRPCSRSSRNQTGDGTNRYLPLGSTPENARLPRRSQTLNHLQLSAKGPALRLDFLALIVLLILSNSGCSLFKPWQEDEYSRAKNAIEGYEDKEGNWVRPKAPEPTR